MKLLLWIAHLINPKHCHKHGCRLQVHGYDDGKFCPKCFDEGEGYTWV